VTEQDIGTRQGAILNAIVHEFIRSGEPVGSKYLVGRFQLTVSSATVRNDMSRLEDLGFLAQPHTSAGRIPTDLGYRFFVDHVPQPVPLEQNKERALEKALASSPADIEEILQKASEVLSSYTRQAAAILAPQLTGSKIRHLDLVRLSPRLVLLVVVVDSGRVEKRVVELDADMNVNDLEAAQAELNKLLADARLADAKKIAAALASTAPAKQKQLMQGVGNALEDIVREESRVFVGGASNLAAAGDSFGESENVPRILEALERQTAIMKLLSGGLGEATSVRIGAEMPEDALQSCSVVMSSYVVGGTPLGTVGVIGPTRMDYEQAMAITRAVARTIQEHIESISG
jgi:heat-inducible transcriptional repressor